MLRWIRSRGEIWIWKKLHVEIGTEKKLALQLQWCQKLCLFGAALTFQL